MPSGPDDKGCDCSGDDVGGDREAEPHAQDGTGKKKRAYVKITLAHNSILTIVPSLTDPWRGGQTEATEEEERQRGRGGDGRRLGVYGQVLVLMYTCVQ